MNRTPYSRPVHPVHACALAAAGTVLTLTGAACTVGALTAQLAASDSRPALVVGFMLVLAAGVIVLGAAASALSTARPASWRQYARTVRRAQRRRLAQLARLSRARARRRRALARRLAR